MASKTYRYYINGPIGSRYLGFIRPRLKALYSSTGSMDNYSFPEPGQTNERAIYPFTGFSIIDTEAVKIDKILTLDNISSGIRESYVDVVFAGRPVDVEFLGYEGDGATQDFMWIDKLKQSVHDDLVYFLFESEDITPPEE